MNSLTESQSLAVEAKGPRILVSAGAGAGKTRVLTERIYHLIRDLKVAPERILALTFTDQAAMEMKERIDRKLGGSEVSVLTFHRFCGKIVRENPLLADVDPAFTLLDEATARPLVRELIEREIYATGSAEVIQWVGECGENTALDLIASFYERWRETPWDTSTLREKTEERLGEEFFKQQKELQTLFTRLAALYQSGMITATGTLTRMQRILLAWTQYTALGWQRSHPSETTVYLQAERHLHELFSEVTRNVSKEAKEIFGKLAVWKKDQLWRELLQDQTASFREGLYTLINQINQAYRAVKEEYGWCDFADLQRRAYHVLQGFKEVREKYGKMYAHVLVDEFQDTSLIQQAILEKLEEGAGKETSLFMVGDVRQSIYRFRGADADGFERIRMQLGNNDSYIPLRENFRSSPSLVAFFSEMTSVLFADEGAASGLLECGQSEQPAVELLIPSLNDAEEPRKAEVRLVAQRILALGPALWGDVAILLQTRTHLAKYQQALDDNQIPYVVYAGSGYWDSQAVQDLYYLMRTIENAEDDIALIGYLRGPLVGMSDYGLWKLAGEVGLRQGFLNFMDSGNTCVPGEDRALLLQAKRIILRLRTLNNETGLGDWLHRVLYEEGVANQLGFHDFEPVIALADELEKRGEFHLSDLLLWWERLREGSDKEGTTQSEAAKGKVRIMTIHAAKGLEFPIVFVPDLTHRYSLGIGRLHFSHHWGATPQYWHREAKAWLPSLSYYHARDEERKAMIAEQKRLLYVAMTRAQELLIFSGAAPSFTEKTSLEECSNWFDWLPFLIPELRAGVTGQIVKRQDWSLQVRGAEEPIRIKKGIPTQTPPLIEMASMRKRLDHSDKPKKRSGSSARMWSVTEWVELLADDRKNKNSGEYTISRVLNKTNLEAYEWGHVLHLVLEHLRSDNDLDYVREYHLKMALASLGITSQVALDISWERLKKDIAAYIKSELHRECCHAQIVHNELPFAVQLFEHDQENSRLSLNGVIDKVWLRPDGKATIVDFKTHKCKSTAQVKRVVAKYSPQVQLYSHVAEKLLHWQVDRAGLYLTATGSFIEVPCDLQVREKLMEKMYRIWTDVNSQEEENERRLFS